MNINYYKKYFNARKVILEMLKDRNLKLNKDYDFNEDTFRVLLKNKNLDIIATNEKNNIKTYVKFTYGILKSNLIKEYIENIRTNFLDNNETNEIIIILDNIPNNLIKLKNCEYININNIQINITKHILVPQHKLVTDEELQTILTKYQITKNKLPLILSSDPIVKYYNFKSGDVCKIIRNSPTSLNHIFYRLVK